MGIARKLTSGPGEPGAPTLYIARMNWPKLRVLELRLRRRLLARLRRMESSEDAILLACAVTVTSPAPYLSGRVAALRALIPPEPCVQHSLAPVVVRTLLAQLARTADRE